MLRFSSSEFQEFLCWYINGFHCIEPKMRIVANGTAFTSCLSFYRISGSRNVGGNPYTVLSEWKAKTRMSNCPVSETSMLEPEKRQNPSCARMCLLC